MSVRFLLTLVRHGETLANREKIMQGQMDTQLSDLGRKQSQLLGVHLKDQIFTHVFSSDLSRAAETAQAIIDNNKSFAGEFVFDSRLRERAFGDLEGKAFPEYRKAADAARVTVHEYTPQGGETLEQVTERAVEFFYDLCKMMAEPLIIKNDKAFLQMSEDIGPRVANSVNILGSPSDIWVTGLMKAEAESLKQPLSLDIPNCNQGPQAGVSSINIGCSTSVTGNMSKASHVNLSSLKEQASTAPSASVLIVSHGLLLRELMRLVLEKYPGKLAGSNSKSAGGNHTSQDLSTPPHGCPCNLHDEQQGGVTLEFIASLKQK